VRLNGDRCGAREFAFDLTFSDTGERFAVSVENAVLHHKAGAGADGASAITLTRAALVGLVLRETGLDDAIEAGSLQVAEGRGTFGDFIGLLDQFDFWFELIAP
jgi:alkyl sulfatase BDS1-like metallo-beta-lactamase superfamily hydrolase